jgi:hypothetical protein
MAEAVIATAAVAAVGKIYSGLQQSGAMVSAAHQADANATTTRQQGNADEERQRRQNAQMLGNQRASAAESGFDPNTGSLATLQVKSAGEAELDAMTTRYSSTLQAIGYENQASSLRSSAKATRINAFMGAASTLAQGAGSYYGMTQKPGG